jgi:hypothetical protein
MDAREEQQTRAGVELWKRRSVALEEVRKSELRALTEEEACRIFADMAFDSEMIWISTERSSAAGMVEQQRLFMLSDEHPARLRRRP